jgi:peptidoglycan/LPS O-acetylase OafA/YrhL
MSNGERTSADLSTSLSGRIPELDGIRGIAIAMVVVYHYFLLPIQAPPAALLSYVKAAGRLAWSGVDLFFVLSGFLIGGILLDARNSSNYFRVFYTRRFFRIVPIYALVLAGAFTLGCLVSWGLADKFAFMVQGRLPWTPYLVFLQNFWMVARNTLGIWGLGATWSLAIEEQFYLTLPLLIRILSPRRLVHVLVAGVLLAPVVRVALHALWPAHIYSWVVMMPCRADALLLGALGAVAMRNGVWRLRLERNRRVLLFVMTILACGFLVLTKYSPTPYDFGMLSAGLTCLASLYACVLLYALANRRSLLSHCLRWGWLGWLGSIAYGTYLLHEPVRGVLLGLVWSGSPADYSLRGFFVSLLALAITLMVCWASWIFFEKPLVRLGHRARYEFKTPETAEAMVVSA